MARLVLVGAACYATFFVVLGGMLPFGTADAWRGPLGAPRTALLGFLLLQVSLATAAAIWVGRRLSRRMLDEPARMRVRGSWQWLVWPVIAGYVLTAAFGCPAVHNAMAHSMASGWAETGTHQARCAPQLETYVSFPVLPGLVFSYVESDACGWADGAFVLHVWNGRSTKRLAVYTTFAA